MWIHLLRHGIAMDRADPGCPPDPERPLTEQGRERTREAMRGFARCKPAIDAIAVSPYLRARQTADIAVRELRLAKLPRLEIAALVPHGDPDAVIRELQGQGERDVLLVGHAPNLDRIVARLCGLHEPCLALKKAGVATLEARALEVGGGRHYTVMAPRVLRNLA